MQYHLKNILFSSIAIFIFSGFALTSSAQINNIEDGFSSLNKFDPEDSVSKLQLRKVIIIGNRRTKDYIILREMQIKPGDSVIISNLNNVLEKDHIIIFPTQLNLFSTNRSYGTNYHLLFLPTRCSNGTKSSLILIIS